MTAHLLDVNVLIALMWPAHEAHARVQHWFSRNSDQGWATCPFTQAGFVRIVTNPAFSSDAVAPREAVEILAASVRHPFHRFWNDDISFLEAVRPFIHKLEGHQQVSDAYLLGLTLHKRGSLITMDRSILRLLPAGCDRRVVTVL